MIQFHPLHWGKILQTINVSGVDAKSGVVTPAKKSATLTKAVGRGSVSGVSGSGGRGGVGGSS